MDAMMVARRYLPIVKRVMQVDTCNYRLRGAFVCVCFGALHQSKTL